MIADLLRAFVEAVAAREFATRVAVIQHASNRGAPITISYYEAIQFIGHAARGAIARSVESA